MNPRLRRINVLGIRRHILWGVASRQIPWKRDHELGWETQILRLLSTGSETWLWSNPKVRWD